MNTVEEWRRAVAFPRYEVSNLGRVRSLFSGGSKTPRETPHVKKQRIGSTGYFETWIGGRPRPVHVQVCLAFHGACPDGHECAHVDGDALNNWAGNLCWKTPLENNRDRILHGTIVRGEEHHFHRLTESEVRIIKASLESGAKIARQFGVDRNTVYRIRSGETWRHVA